MELAGMSFDVRQTSSGLSFLDMTDLSHQVDRRNDPKPSLPKYSIEYKPMRDALMHTSRLTAEAKHCLTNVYNNIKARIRLLLYS